MWVSIYSKIKHVGIIVVYKEEQQQHHLTSLRYKNIICLFSFSFIAWNIWNGGLRERIKGDWERENQRWLRERERESKVPVRERESVKGERKRVKGDWERESQQWLRERVKGDWDIHTQSEIWIFSEPLLCSAFTRLIQSQHKTFNCLNSRTFSRKPFFFFFKDTIHFWLQQIYFLMLFIFTYKAI